MKQAIRGHSALAEKIGIKESVRTVFPKVQEPEAIPSTSKFNFTERQLEDIDLLFAEIVNTNAALTILQVKNIMSESADLIEFVDDSHVVNKVYRRVKYLQSKNFEENVNTIPEEEEEKTSLWVESISKTSGSSSRRFTWSGEDTAIMEMAFKNFDHCPRKAEMLEVFNSQLVLKDVMKRNTFNRCYEKIKNIFKKRT